MHSLFAYLIAFLSVVYAVILHKFNAQKFWLPCLFAALISAFSAVGLFQFLDPRPLGTSNLQIAVAALLFGFALAVLIGYFIKVLPNLFE